MYLLIGSLIGSYFNIPAAVLPGEPIVSNQVITFFGSAGGRALIGHLLAHAQAELSQFDDAWLCIGEATTLMKASKEKWCEAEIQSHCR